MASVIAAISVALSLGGRSLRRHCGRIWPSAPSTASSLRHAHPALHRDTRNDARGLWHGLLLAGNQSVSVSYDTGFTVIGQDDFFGFPIPAWIAPLAYIAGWVILERLPIGRHVLAIGDGEATAAV